MDRYHEAFMAEQPPGDDYGLSVGHWVLPSGQLLAIPQSDDRTARALVHAGWAAWQEVLGA